MLRIEPVLAQAFHVANYWFIFNGSDGAPPGTVPYWSLAVEEHFYLAFPVLYITLGRLMPDRARGWTLWGLCAAVCVWRCILVIGFDAPENRTYMASDTRFDSILFGCALATTMNPACDPAVGSDHLWKRVLLPVGILALLFTFLYREPWFRETVRYSVQGLGLMAIFVTAIRFPRWGPFRLLNTRPVAFVGALSYTLYLSHQIVLVALEYRLPTLGQTPRAILALAIAGGTAYLLHIWVEKPSARLRKRWSARPQRRLSAAVR